MYFYPPSSIALFTVAAFITACKKANVTIQYPLRKLFDAVCKQTVEKDEEEPIYLYLWLNGLGDIFWLTQKQDGGRIIAKIFISRWIHPQSPVIFITVFDKNNVAQPFRWEEEDLIALNETILEYLEV